MSKKNTANVDATAIDATTVDTTQSPAVATGAPNYTLHYRKDHPKNRCSYGVAGVAGIVVFDKNLFAGEPPLTITLDVELAQPKPDAKAAKAEAAAQKAAEKLAKAEERRIAAELKAAEKAEKAQKALEAAQARAAEAAAKLAANVAAGAEA